MSAEFANKLNQLCCRIKNLEKDCCECKAYGLILSEELPNNGGPREDGVQIDDSTSSSGIVSVERLSQGKYQINFESGTFSPDCGNPVVLVTPCESLFEDFPTEQAVIICEEGENIDSITITTGRILVIGDSDTILGIPILVPPEVRDSVSFHFMAIQNCNCNCT